MLKQVLSLKVIAVPDKLEELLIAAQKKLDLPSVTSVYTKNGGLVDAIELIRDDEVLYVSSEVPVLGMIIRYYFYVLDNRVL